MALIKKTIVPEFDTEEIALRDFVRAKYHTWDEPRNGLVVSVTASELLVIFLPLIHLATRYYTIKAQEVADGKWSILYSHDLEMVGKAGTEDGDGGNADSAATAGE